MRLRAIYSDNGVLSDFSRQVIDYNTGTKTLPLFVAAEDYIYIGQHLPFNHLYLKLATANATATPAMTVSCWDGDEWIAVDELIDETNGLRTSGFIHFVPNRDDLWMRDDTNYQSNTITGLTTVKIFNLYWVRIAFSADFDANVALSWVGNKFSTDSDLESEYPDLLKTDILDAFKTAKTDWEQQHVLAAEYIIADLEKRNVIYDRGQILNRDKFTLASVSKVAEIVYKAFGRDFADHREVAYKNFREHMSNLRFDIDKNMDGISSTPERVAKQGVLSR